MTTFKFFDSPLFLLLINICIFLFGTLMLSVKSGYSIVPFLLAILSLFVLFKKTTYQLSKPAKYYLGAISIYFLVLIISHLMDLPPIQPRDFESSARLLVAIMIFLLLYQFAFSFKALTYGFLVGTYLAGFIAIYDKFLRGLARAFSTPGRTFVIQAGDISLSMGLICLCIMFYYYQQKNRSHTLLFLMASLLGILGSFLSGTRGGWIMLPVTLLILCYMYYRYLSKSAKWSALLILCFSLFVCTLPQTGVPTRIKQAVNDIHLYNKGENKNTSLGIRFMLWKSSWHSFTEQPIFGWGEKGVFVSRKQQYQNGLIPAMLYQDKLHAHNEFLDEMAKRGVIGLCSLLAIFLIPLNLMRKKFKHSSSAEVETIAGCAIIMILSTIDFCLSQAFLKHNSGIMFYFCSLSIFMAFCYPKFNHVQIHR